MKRYDVAVIGGGFAGVAAAIAAARGGAKVLIVEKSNSLGGAAVTALVNPFMQYSTKINGEKVALSTGIFREIHKRLEDFGSMGGESFLEEDLKFILNEIAEEEGISLLYHAYIFKVNKDGDKIKSIVVATIKGEMEIEADYFIDATGDAQVAYLAGCPFMLGRAKDNLCQPMTLCFRVGNIDIPKFKEGRAKLNEAYAKAFADGEFLNERENLLIFGTPIPNVLHFNTTRVVKKNPTDPEDVTEAEILVRKQVYEVYNFIKKHGEGLENSFLMMTAQEIGVRESRKIIGDYVLTEADCRAFTKFEDGIAACNYDIDIHNPEGSGTSHYYFPDGEYYTIPYRSLIPTGLSNMLVAGRCISADHGAQASFRIMPTVCCIGEAAGSAIAMAFNSKSSVRAVDTQVLRETLKKNGAFIG